MPAQSTHKNNTTPEQLCSACHVTVPKGTYCINCGASLYELSLKQRIYDLEKGIADYLAQHYSDSPADVKVLKAAYFGK